MAETRPTGEQLRFVSSQTGEHVLDAYLEAAEKGTRTLGDMLEDVWNPTSGLIRSDLIQFRIPTGASQLQTRTGDYVDPNLGWSNVPGGHIFRNRGVYTNGTAYERLDLFVHNNALYVTTVAHTASAAAPDSTKTQLAISNVAATIAYKTVTALKALTSATDGAVVRLSETGKTGVFVFIADNLSAQVTADPWGALTIAPDFDTTGASGAWVRIVDNNIYRLTWWGVVAGGVGGSDSAAKLQAALDLIPNGARLLWPPFDVSVGSVVFARPGKEVHIEGDATRKSRLVTTTAAGSGTYHLIQVMGDGSSVRRLGFAGNTTGAAAGEPACLLVGKGHYEINNPVYGVVRDILVDDCWVDSGDSGIIVVAYLVPKAGAVVADPANGVYQSENDIDLIYNVTVRNCHVNARRNGIAFYAAMDCHEHNNTVTITPPPSSTAFSAGLRVLGCFNLFSRNSRFGYTTETTAVPAPEEYGIYYALSGFNDGKIRIANKNCTIRGHEIRNAAIPFGLQTWYPGSLTLENCKSRGNLDGTMNRPAILLSSGSNPAGFTRLHISNLDIEGCSQILKSDMPVKDFLFENVKWVANAFTGDNGNGIFYMRDVTPATMPGSGAVNPAKGYGLIRVLRNQLLSKGVTYGEIQIIEAVAATKAIVMDNWTSPDGGAAFAQTAFATGDAAAQITTDGVNYTAPDVAVARGLNYRFPTGMRDLTAQGA